MFLCRKVVFFFLISQDDTWKLAKFNQAATDNQEVLDPKIPCNDFRKRSTSIAILDVYS